MLEAKYSTREKVKSELEKLLNQTQIIAMDGVDYNKLIDNDSFKEFLCYLSRSSSLLEKI